jgi:predicted dehydrogenase
MSEKILRSAILGCGSFAHRHAQNLAALSEETELVALCDHNPESAQAYCEKYTAGKAVVYTDYHTMLEREKLDLLVIALPPFAHTDEVECAAERGVHLLMEKPIALTMEQAWKMVETVESAGIQSQVGFMWRFGEAIEALKAMIDSGDAGLPGLMSARYFCNSLHSPWWRSREKSGGQLVEQIIHMVDLIRYLLGRPSSVYSRQENLFHQDVPGYTVEDTSATIFGFRSGALGVIYASNGAIPNRWINDYRVVTRNVTAEFSNANNAVFHMTAQDGVPQRVITSERNVHRAELLDLIQAIRTGGQTRTPMREGALSLELALAATTSAQTHQEVLVG